MKESDKTIRERARQLATEVGLFGGMRGEHVQFLTTVLVMFAENEILRYEAAIREPVAAPSESQ